MCLFSGNTRGEETEKETKELTSENPEADKEDPYSPRVSVRDYINLCREGKYKAASFYLSLGPQEKPREQELAKRLKKVLDRYLWIEYARLSPSPKGFTNDGLPLSLEEIGGIQGPHGKEKVFLERVKRNGEFHWVFSSATVRLIDRWYGYLGSTWILDFVPEILQLPGPLELQWWQWIAVYLLFLLAYLLSLLAGQIIFRILTFILSRNKITWDEELLNILRQPFVFFLTLSVIYLSLPFLSLVAPAQDLIIRFLRAGFYVLLFWTLWKGTTVFFKYLSRPEWTEKRPGLKGLLPIFSRFSKAGLLVLATIAILQELGFHVTGLLAGLGIGGLAMALAAQKTIENLFGSITLSVDQPFREGDFVKIQDFVGTVEKIGLRSTRIRTLDRTVITLPNATLADSRLESYTARDRIRLYSILGLVYETTIDQMKNVMKDLKTYLGEHPRVWSEAVCVRFVEFAPYSLNLEIMIWIETQDWNVFCDIRGEIFLAFMGIVGKNGTSFAFPTRTIHMAKENPVSGSNKIE